MPRQARNLGKTGWAHIILRGINRENLFYDDEDYSRFDSTVKRYQREFGFELAIMCMMGNHVHFLLREENGLYGQIIKKIALSYAIYYNKKYERVGPVFQDRFRSEPVNDERYYLTVLRYIYQNPQKAGICPADSYPHTVMNASQTASGYFETEESLRAYLNERNKDSCMEYDTTAGLNGEEAIELIAEVSGCENPQGLQCLDKAARDKALRELKSKGLSVRQLSRLTGINRNIVQRA